MTGGGVVVKRYLEGLHLTAADLASGIKAASRRPSPESAAFLKVLEKASGVGGETALLNRLREGWRPSLDDLLDAGLDALALRWMPEGAIEIKIDGRSVRISSHRLVDVMHQIAELSVHERQEWLMEFVRVQSLLPGSIYRLNRISI